MSDTYVGCRIDPQIKEIAERVSKERGSNLSNFIRYLVIRELASLSYLSGSTKKALGFSKFSPILKENGGTGSQLV